ncbi:MAG: hypothetical protein WBA23_04910 [Tunicatimonas sp.]|uniref:hypothetical protein n=1 Tax=Tunicatimonas sp. TaxID=1940096 RepID=UPI003C71AAA8
MDTFEEYLTKKKIDSTAFRQSEELMWQDWSELFQAIHPDSFTAQKLFLINKIRRRFPQEATKN